MLKRLLLHAALAAFLAGCQTAAAPVPTMQVNADVATFTNALLARKGAAGYMITSQTPNVIVLEKTELHDLGTVMLFGTGYGPPRLRLTYQMFGADPLNVQVAGVIVSNAGTAFEKSYGPAADKIVQEARAEVNTIAAELAATPSEQ